MLTSDFICYVAAAGLRYACAGFDTPNTEPGVAGTSELKDYVAIYIQSRICCVLLLTPDLRLKVCERICSDPRYLGIQVSNLYCAYHIDSLMIHTKQLTSTL